MLRFAAALASARGGRGRAAVRSRATVLGVGASLAMLVLVVTLGGQLTSLQTSPSSWGWVADFGVASDSLRVDDQVTHDQRVRDVDQVVDAPVHLVHHGQISRVTGYGRKTLLGALPYRLTAGRMPRTDGEIALGPRLADDFGVHIGDSVELSDLAGVTTTMRVTGIVVMPTLEDEPLGRNVLMPMGALQQTAISTGYSNLLVRAVDPAAATSLRTELARSVEIEEPTAPSTIVALGKLAAPQRLLIIVLLFGGMLLVAEHVSLLVRRRGNQMAIAASIGMTRRQLIVATASATVLTAAMGVVIGAPLGWALSRVVLVEIGPGLGLGLAGPGIVTSVLIALAGLLAALIVAGALAVLGLRRRTIMDLRGFGASA